MNPESIETKAPQKHRGRSALLVPALVLGGGYLIWSTVFAEDSSGLIWLLLLACPLMHFLMPHGHGGSKKKEQQSEAGADSLPEPPGSSSKS